MSKNPHTGSSFDDFLKEEGIYEACTAAAHLGLNQMVDVREEAGRIIIEPVQQPEFDLASLVAGITDQNLHEEIELV